MENYNIEVQVRWSDLDPNVHLRHSVYYDWGAYNRIEFLSAHGLPVKTMEELQIGPILFREECVFKREIRLGDKVTIDMELVAAKADFSRWTIRHNIRKNDDTLSAVLTVEGAWLDVVKRKLALPPQQVVDAFEIMPKAVEFQWIEKK